MPDDERQQPDAAPPVPGAEAATEPAGAVRPPTVTGLPEGYIYGITRYADVILNASFPVHFHDLATALGQFRISVAELRAGGGSRTPFVKRFDSALEERGWGKRTIEIGKTIDGKTISTVRGHEIDMFAVESEAEPYPGVAVEMEWNNKDPFYDRDLLNFQALHREGALAVGIIVTRGPVLQRLIERTILNQDGEEKYGESTTHWHKLIPRVNLGGGGECPLLLVGIELARIDPVDDVLLAQERLAAAEDLRAGWHTEYQRWRDAKPVHDQMLAEARAAMSAAGDDPAY